MNLFSSFRYGVRVAAERSGAYLFLPDGDAVPLRIENTVVNIIEGSIFSSVQVQVPYVHHTVTLYNTPGESTSAISQHVQFIMKLNFLINLKKSLRKLIILFRCRRFRFRNR